MAYLEMLVGNKRKENKYLSLMGDKKENQEIVC